MPLIQVFYVSRASTPYDSGVVQEILSTSRRNNRRDDVTGCLLFSGRFYGQVLEGRADVVADKLRRISADPRHTDFRLLIERAVALREYGDWSMGYLHDLELEDTLEQHVLGMVSPPRNVFATLERMKPDTIMGALA